MRGVADQVWEQGRAFGTIGVRVRGRTFEVTTHRAEVYRADSRKPSVTFGDDVEVDLSRRDFTINAMALDLASLRLIDPFGGAADLAQHRLATPLDPEVSFGDDPLRMLRAARFLARFELVADEALVSAPRRTSHRASRSSRPSASATSSTRSSPSRCPPSRCGSWCGPGWPTQFLPELEALALEQDPIHRHKDVLAHTLAVVDKTSKDRLLRLAALFHDVGKPKTRAIGPDGVSFHHHEVVGARMTKARMEQLRYSSDDLETVTRLVELHLRFHTYKMGWTDRAVRRYVRDAGAHLARLNELTRCDCTTRNARRAEELCRADGRARGAHRRAARARGARRDAPRARRRSRSWPGSASLRAATSARRSRSCSTCASTRGCSVPKRLGDASTPGGRTGVPRAGRRA